jgi:uncharacterized membrane protein
MVLFIPGYVLISAFFPKKDDLDDIERIAFSFGLSIAVVPLIGLLLNFTRFGIRLVPILIGLSIYAIILIIVGEYRRESLIEKDRIPFHKIYSDIINEIGKPRDKIDSILIILLVISVFTTIGMVIYVITIPKVGERFTEFYLLNSSTGMADNYNTNLKLHVPVKYLMGVANHEYSIVNYTIDVVIGEDIIASKNLTIDNDQEWKYNLTIYPEKSGNDMKLKFLLFKEENFTSPYRELHLWVNVS